MFDLIQGVIEGVGYVGIAFLMFLENVFPPIPSEVIMPLAGFTAAKGDLTLWGVLVSGVIGSLAGAYLWYWIGLRIGRERVKAIAARHGRWLTLAPEDIDRAQGWFDRHGGMAVMIGRLIPTVRTFISVPAGVARMNWAVFCVFSAIGTAVWTAILTATGYVLEDNYDAVSDWLNPISTAVVVLLVAAYLYRVVTYRRRVAAPPGGGSA